MPPRRLPRLIAWYAIAIALLIVQLGKPNRIKFAIAELLIAAMTFLLCTTPPHAIRLKRELSELLLLAGTILLQFNAANTLPAGIITLFICIASLAVLRLWRITPWWAALIAWNPFLSIAANMLAIHAAR